MKLMSPWVLIAEICDCYTPKRTGNLLNILADVLACLADISLACWTHNLTHNQMEGNREFSPPAKTTDYAAGNICTVMNSDFMSLAAEPKINLREEKKGKESLAHSRLKKKKNLSSCCMTSGVWLRTKGRMLLKRLQVPEVRHFHPKPASPRWGSTWSLQPLSAGGRAWPGMSAGQFKYTPFFSFLLSCKSRLSIFPQWWVDTILNNNLFIRKEIFSYQTKALISIFFKNKLKVNCHLMSKYPICLNLVKLWPPQKFILPLSKTPHH